MEAISYMSMNKIDSNHLLQLVKEEFAAPFNDLLGIKIVEASYGKVILELQGREALANSLKIVHGGATATLCDVAMGAAIGTLGLIPITVEMKINYLSPGQIDGTITAKGKVIKSGKTLVISEGEIYQGDKLLAKSLGTYSTKTPEEVDIGQLHK